jgi:carboxylesterase type B
MNLSAFLRRATGAIFLTAMVTSAGNLSAQTNSTTAATPPKPKLDNDEMVHLQQVRAEVLTQNPDLKTEEDKLKAMHDSAAAASETPDQRSAAFAEWKAYREKMRAAMLKIDPTLAPVFAKLDKIRKHAAATAPESDAK